MTAAPKPRKKRKPKLPFCPSCGETLSINGRYPSNEPGTDEWLECCVDDCDLLGLEGFRWHWEKIAQWKALAAANAEEPV